MRRPKCHLDNPETQKFCGDCGTLLPPSGGIRSGVTETNQTPVDELTTGSTLAGRVEKRPYSREIAGYFIVGLPPGLVFGLPLMPFASSARRFPMSS